MRAALPRRIWDHPANQGGRVQALGRAAAFQFRGRVLGRPTLVDVNGATIMAHVGWTPSSRVVYANPPDYGEMNAWRRVLRAGDLFLDVGASVGVYAIWAATLGAEVVAFEPDGDSLSLLRDNVSANPTLSIEIVEAAVADRVGTVQFSKGHRATGSIGDGDPTPATTIDASLDGRHARGVKVDVEGFEEVVLAGALAALAEQRIDVFQLEWNRRSLQAVGTDREPAWRTLEQHGYQLARPDLDGVLRPIAFNGFGEDVFAVSPAAAGHLLAY
jgi:FkbM family methyltransferase